VRASGATKTLARCLSALASARLFAGDLDKAHALHEEAIGVYRELGESLGDPLSPERSRAGPSTG
jgi:hypothetical protein